MIMQLSNSKRMSLWLIPPDHLRTTLSSIQADIISNHPKDCHLPRFLPHVTLLGGVPISDCFPNEQNTGYVLPVQCKNPQNNIDIDEDAAQIVLRRLQRAFQSHGGITCDFNKERGVFAARDEDGEVKWNQSCLSIIERGIPLMRAIQVADEAFFSTMSTKTCNNERLLPGERHFKPPLFEPHYSFVYGNEAHLVPASLDCPPSFTSTEMVLMWTYPSTLEGVEEWREIGRFSLI
mmetsp:Transcript_21569/g.46917  ORF Transcript_21569/g.46917 Transcript_21569/m.46917 type:complete len:235 (+) Transcript_21569:240-944(+)